jgi:thioredoxin-like negative regulator of GroEL
MQLRTTVLVGTTVLMVAILCMAGTVAEPAPPSARRTAATSASAEPVRWHTDFYEAHRVAVSLDRPLLVVFGADWCRHCGRFEKDTLRRSDISAAIDAGFVPVHLDYDRDRRIAEILEVRSLPCTVVLNPEADLLGRVVGYAGADQFHAALRSAMAVQARIRLSMSAALDRGR